MIIKKKSLEISTLRGVAILFVLISHSSLIVMHNQNYTFYLGSITGRIGVYIFFILSGYCITNSLINIWGQKLFKSRIKNFLIFLKKRFIRLFPMYYISIILGLFLLDIEISTKEFFINLTMIQSILNIKSIQGVYWSLSFEIIFYITIAIIYLMNIFNKKLFFLIKFFPFFPLILALIGNFLSLNLKSYAAFHFSLFFFGCNFFFINQKIKKIIMDLTIYFICLYFVLSLITISDEEFFVYIYSHILSIFIFLTLYYGKIKIKLLEFYGNLSYTLYLTHGILIAKLSYLVSNKVGIFLVQLISSTIFAYILYFFIEKKIIKLLKKVKYIT